MDMMDTMAIMLVAAGGWVGWYAAGRSILRHRSYEQGRRDAILEMQRDTSFKYDPMGEPVPVNPELHWRDD